MNQLSFTLSGAVSDLEGLLSQLSKSDRDFANSLINGPYGFRKRGFLTPKQEPHIYRLLEKAVGAAPTEEKTVVEGMQSIVQMFEHAKQHLKFPKIVVPLENGQKVKMWVQGEKAKYPGGLGILVDGSGSAGFGRMELSTCITRSRSPRILRRSWISFRSSPTTPLGWLRSTGSCQVIAASVRSLLQIRSPWQWDMGRCVPRITICRGVPRS